VPVTAARAGDSEGERVWLRAGVWLRVEGLGSPVVDIGAGTYATQVSPVVWRWAVRVVGWGVGLRSPVDRRDVRRHAGEPSRYGGLYVYVLLLRVGGGLAPPVEGGTYVGEPSVV